jgi:hypothetical protein
MEVEVIRYMIQVEWWVGEILLADAEGILGCIGHFT